MVKRSVKGQSLKNMYGLVNCGSHSCWVVLSIILLCSIDCFSPPLECSALELAVLIAALQNVHDASLLIISLAVVFLAVLRASLAAGDSVSCAVL